MAPRYAIDNPFVRNNVRSAWQRDGECSRSIAGDFINLAAIYLLESDHGPNDRAVARAGLELVTANPNINMTAYDCSIRTGPKTDPKAG
jgi:hypothetical protein